MNTALSAFLLAPRIRLLLTIVRVYKSYLLIYLFTYLLTRGRVRLESQSSSVYIMSLSRRITYLRVVI